MTARIEPHHIQNFNDLGYCVIENFKSHDELSALKKRAIEIVADHDFEQNKTIFTTDRSNADVTVTSQDYFLDSDNAVRCFFEEEAFDDQGRLTQDLERSINKIGHAMHDLDPVFKNFSSGGRLNEIALSLGQAQPELRQSMYIFKQPKIGGKVDWHQDASFFHTSPHSVLTFWFAIDDATITNGCLQVEPGGHRSPLREQFCRSGREIEMRPLDSTPWPASGKAVSLEVNAGTLVVFHGHLPHFSASNRSDKPRHALTLHVTDGACAYSSDNWIQRGADFPVRGFVKE